MTKHIESILLALLIGIGCLTLWAVFISVAECHSHGGTTVRGLVWLECIR